MHPKRLAIIGVGLLGGSIGLATRSVVSDYKIVGYGHRRATLEKATEIGAIDEAYEDLAEAVQHADLVVLCTPVGVFPEVLKTISTAAQPGTLVTDVGSTKRSVIQQAQQLLPQTVHFVGSHPMAGSEKRGIDFARADLFRGAMCILTPGADANSDAVQTIDDFWKSLGMRTTRMSPDDHDRLVAQISHLPHAVASALISMQNERGFDLAGKGFLDTTRVASGDGALWRDILVDNQDNLRESIKHLVDQLNHLANMMTPENAEQLRAYLDAAAQKREALVKRKLNELTSE